MVFPITLAMIYFLASICSYVHCRRATTPEIIFLPSNAPFHQTQVSRWINRYTLAALIDENQTISLRCKSDEPTRWIVWYPDQTIHRIDMEKTRIKRGNETEFFSDLVWRFNASHNRSTLFDCLHEADWTTGRLKLKSLKQIVGSTVVIKSTENDTYEFGIEITINRNSSVADFHPWNQTKGETCSTNLAFVASNGKVDPMCVDGESELAHSQPCGNLDECDSFSLWHILPWSRHCEADFHDFSGEPGGNSLLLSNYPSPMIFYCGEIYYEESWWNNFATVFPSFIRNNWESYAYYATFEQAVETNSIHITLPNYSKSGELRDFDFPLHTMAFAINQTIEVACIAVKFLYMRGFQWQLGPNQIIADQDTQTYYTDTKRSLLVSKRNITFDPNVFGKLSSWVACQGPIWNSENWQTSQRLSFALFAPSPPEGNLTHIVNADGLDQFSCNYQGWPKPKVTWIFSANVTSLDTDRNANKSFPDSPGDTWNETRVVIGERSSSYTVFCKLVNFKGSVRLSNRPTITINGFNSAPTTSVQGYIIGGLISGILLVILVLALVYWGWRKNWNFKLPFQKTTNRNEDSEHVGFNKDFELSIKDCSIHKDKLLGSGAFGTVHEGQVRGRTVAMKQPNSDYSKTAFESILCELKVLSHLGTNKNVVGFIGAYMKEIKEGYLLIAIELCTNGSLESHLRKKISVQEKNINIIGANGLPEDAIYSSELYRYSFEIASGMSYIESRNIVHGDLATRNVLLNQFNICKITDFGLSRKMYEYQSYLKTSQQPLPWKWMAYESLTKMMFTSKSDVWSYGVTLWEIFSLGNVPYGGLNWTTAFTNDLKLGLRLSIPEFAPNTIFDKMLKCWDIDSNARPTFSEMAEFLKQFCGGQYAEIV